MIIRLASTLTREDENKVAAALLKIAVSIFDLVPIGYALSIETSDGRRYQHSSQSAGAPDNDPVEAAARR